MKKWWLKPKVFGKVLWFIPLLFGPLGLKAQTDPNITSWQINTTGHQAQYYASDGTTVVNLNDSSEVQQVCYNTDTLYVRTNILGSFVMGPWPGDPFTADGKDNSYVFPRTPTYPSTTHQTKPVGIMALQINGVAIYDDGDGKSYNTSTGTNSNSGSGVWNQIAWVAHIGEMDSGNGHPDPNSTYHNHHNPIALCDVITGGSHSPIIGYAFDGWPIYGPFGYSDATDASSSIARMTPSWQLRNITTRTTFYDGSTASQTGPAVSTSFPLGTYIEDYEYVASMGDLDYYNGRWCVTPEYPSGTYAYFLNTDASGNASYPNMIGPKFYGKVFLTNFGTSGGSASAPVVGTSCYTPPNGCVVSSSSTNVSCSGLSDGTATVSVTNATGTVNYSWSPSGGSAATATGLAAGTYTCTITDGGTCSETETVTITAPSTATSVSTSATNVLCNGNTNGAVNATVSGTPYGSTSPGLILSEIHADPSAANDSPLEFVELVATKDIDFTSTPYTVVFANNGPATTNGWKAGAGVTYAFEISTGSVTQGQVVYVGGSSMTPTSNVIRSINTGTTAGDGSIGNANTAGVLGNGGPAADGVAVFNVGASSITSSTVPVDALFFGTSTGMAVVSSGSAGYQLPVNDKYSGGKLQTTSSLASSPVSGQYLKATGTYDLQAGSFSTARTWANTATFTDQATSVSLINMYDYSWSNGASTEDISGLTAGTYTITVTDGSGCPATSTATVTQPTAVSGSIATTNVSCFGTMTGALNLTPTGGNSSYTYSWNNGITTQDQGGVVAGSYSVTITDGNGCTGTASATVTQPSAALSASATATAASCAGGDGSINLTVTGGTTAYSYSWSNGATTEDISSLSAGSYSVTVTDSKGCTATASATVTSASGMTTSVTSSNPNCSSSSDGSINLTVSGGSTPYTYLWSNGSTVQDPSGLAAGTYTVTVTDNGGCTATASATLIAPTALSASATGTNPDCGNSNDGSVNLSVSGGTTPYTFAWTNSSTSEDLSGLGSGTYGVTVTDAHGCTATASASLAAPTGISLSTSTTDPSCDNSTDGAVDLSVSGGTSPYTYSWSNSATTQDLSGTGSGTFTVTVTDNNGCTASASATLNAAVSITLTNSSVNPDCHNTTDGSVDLTVSGGATPYTYSWSNGATTQDLTSLAGGTFTVTVTDNNGCGNSASVTITAPTALTSSVATQNSTCFASNNGSADLTVTGGTAPYSYAWSNGSTTQDLSGLGAVSYTVTITDANGCTANGSATTTEPTAISASATGTDPLCNTSTNGSVDLTVNGGTTPYTYYWNNSSTSQDLTAVGGGSFSVTVTDANGCTATASATLTAPPAITANTSTTAILCNGGTNGAVDLTVAGGTSPYTYVWSNSATIQDLSGLGAGTYSVTVTDANGCTKTASATLSQPTALNVTGTVTNETPAGNNGAVDITVSGGTSPYTYLWTNSSTTQDLAGIQAGNYTVTITDNNGCTTSESFVVSNTLSLQEESDLSISLYPNPAQDLVHFSYNNQPDGITVTDLNGRFIASSKESDMDVSNWERGVYLVLFHYGERVVIKQLIKQ